MNYDNLICSALDKLPPQNKANTEKALPKPRHKVRQYVLPACFISSTVLKETIMNTLRRPGKPIELTMNRDVVDALSTQELIEIIELMPGGHSSQTPSLGASEFVWTVTTL
jgi:hypothetical protein